MKKLFLQYPKCTTCRKAKKFLQENNIDFDDRDIEKNILKEDSKDEDFYDEDLSTGGNGKFFFKILMLIFGIVLVLVIGIYLLNYFNRV